MSELTPDAHGLLLQAIAAFVQDSPANRHAHLDGAPIFDAPLFACADGDDPLFTQYKTIIGPFHLTPREALAYALEQAGGNHRGIAPTPAASHAALEQVRVLTWVLPVAEQTRRSNRTEHDGPSERWAHTRWYGEQFNDEVRRFAVKFLQNAGYAAIAPVVSPLFETLTDPTIGLCSTWSERHVLYAAGQGTFSLNDGFITVRGMAMRCGSVVTNLPLAVTPRPYASHTENCLHFREGTCGDCIARCPAGAISLQGHDKKKCRAYTYGALKPYFDRYQVAVTGCGLCQTAVPCETAIPPGPTTG